jgi:hypothetical protein
MRDAHDIEHLFALWEQNVETVWAIQQVASETGYEQDCWQERKLDPLSIAEQMWRKSHMPAN